MQLKDEHDLLHALQPDTFAIRTSMQFYKSIMIIPNGQRHPKSRIRNFLGSFHRSIS